MRLTILLYFFLVLLPKAQAQESVKEKILTQGSMHFSVR